MSATAKLRQFDAALKSYKTTLQGKGWTLGFSGKDALENTMAERGYAPLAFKGNAVLFYKATWSKLDLTDKIIVVG